MLIKLRKKSTNVIYSRICGQFSLFASKHLTVADVLLLLQQGLHLGLSLATLKYQVLAISAFSGLRWALHDFVTQFFKAVWQLKHSQKLFSKVEFCLSEFPIFSGFGSGQ